MISDHRNRLALNVEDLGAILKQLGMFCSDRSDRYYKSVRPVSLRTEPMAPMLVPKQGFDHEQFFFVNIQIHPSKDMLNTLS